MAKQTELFKTHWNFRFCHGGELRRSRRGRGARPLSGKAPIHLVFKLQKGACKTLRGPVTHTLVQGVLRQYAKRFFVKIEQVAIHHDHIHLLIRISKRSLGPRPSRPKGSLGQARVTGTFKLKKERQFWKHRPYTRVIQGYKAYLIVQNYVRLNEKEAQGTITYRKQRLKGISPEDLASLWS